ncbi:hypothetical protein SDC9_182345 [bioreactor metagenome]|uniref:Uncharacterized protein n=1 Tax=bioreactor metagenome TaxID=1076179 RepID=A0A645H746_9ZZZZ
MQGQTEGGQQFTQLTIGVVQRPREVIHNGLRRGVILRNGAFEQRQLNAQIREHLRQRVMQFTGNSGALFHQQQLLEVFLRMVEVQAAPQHCRYAV